MHRYQRPDDVDEGASRETEAPSSHAYRVQIGMYDTMAEAKKLSDTVSSMTDHEVYIEYKPPFYRVGVGDFTSKREAESCVDFFRGKGYNDARYIFRTGDSP